jgi:hypothetical protein
MKSSKRIDKRSQKSHTDKAIEIIYSAGFD